MKKLLFLCALWSKNTNPVAVNSPSVVEMKEVASSAEVLTYLGFSLPGNVFTLQVEEPPSCDAGIFTKRSASGRKLYNEVVAAGESIQNGLCFGAPKNPKPLSNIVWQEIPLGGGSSVALSAENDPVDPQQLQCINGILYPPINEYKSAMSKCEDAHAGETNIFCFLFVSLMIGVCYYSEQIGSAARSCMGEVQQRLSRLPHLLSGQRRRGSAVEGDDVDVTRTLVGGTASSSSTHR